MIRLQIGAGAKFLLLAAFALVALQMQSGVSQAAACDKQLENKASEMIHDGDQFTCSMQVGEPPQEKLWTCYANYWYIPAHQACERSYTATGKCCEVRRMNASYHGGVCGGMPEVCNIGVAIPHPQGQVWHYYAAVLHNCDGDDPHANCTE